MQINMIKQNYLLYIIVEVQTQIRKYALFVQRNVATLSMFLSYLLVDDLCHFANSR